jgi:hypothetical protein
MSPNQFILYAVIIGSLSSCATTLPVDDTTQVNDPRILAQEQWSRCAHFPSVELVEITTSGQLLVRDKITSNPPTRYFRCISAVAYEQVIAGRRDASDVVRYAFFTEKPPPRGPLSEIGELLPSSVKQFDAGQDVTFFYGLEGLNSRREVAVVWLAPQGVYRRTTQFIGPTRPRFQWSWRTDQIELPEDRSGIWSVRMFIEGRPAGEYQFQVLNGKV